MFSFFSSCSPAISSLDVIITRLQSEEMKKSRVPTTSESRGVESCSNSLLETTTNAKGNFSFPEALLQSSMSKYERQAKEKLQLSMLVDDISRTIHDIVDQLLHEKIYSEITKIINEVLCIREEVSTFSREGSLKQEEVNEEMKAEIRKIKRRVEEIASKSHALHFPSFVSQSQSQLSRTKSTAEVKYSQGVEGIIHDVYDFMQKNEATKLFRECQGKLEKLQVSFKQANLSLAEKLQDLKKKQKPINENLRKQLSDALSKDTINKEIKRCLKEHIRYLFDELVRSRKDIDQFKDELKGLCERQRELQFSQTMLEHKMG